MDLGLLQAHARLPLDTLNLTGGCRRRACRGRVTERVRARVLSWVVHVVIVGGLVADAVLVWVGMGVADDVPRRAEAHEAENEVGMGARDGADGRARGHSDIGGGIGWVRDG